MTHDFICSWFMGHQHFRMRLAVGMAKAKFRGKDSNCQRLGSNKRPWCGRSMANFHLRHGAGSWESVLYYIYYVYIYIYIYIYTYIYRAFRLWIFP